MQYAFIATHAAEFAVVVMCHALEVSVSGDYAWHHRGPSAHAQADGALSARIGQACLAGRGVYGSPRIHATLYAQGGRCARKRVARLMRSQGLCARRPRRHQPHTTDSQHSQPIAPHLVGRDFTAEAPNRKWVADITGIPTRSGWLYLAGILDVYSRRAIGYAMDGYRDERLGRTALDMALVSRRPPAGQLIHHSDRGSQYSSTGYRGLLEEHGIRMSMSGKGEPYDNAMMESFLSTLKSECVKMRQAARLPDTGGGAHVRLRVPGGLLQPTAPAFLTRLSLPDGLRAIAGRYLTLRSLHEIGATPGWSVHARCEYQLEIRCPTILRRREHHMRERGRLAAALVIVTSLGILISACGRAQFPGASTPTFDTLHVIRQSTIPSNHYPLFDKTSTNAPEIDKLYALIQTLPPFPSRATIACPADLGLRYTLTFKQRDGATVEVLVYAQGCAGLTIGHNDERMITTDGFWRQLARTLDVSEDDLLVLPNGS